MSDLNALASQLASSDFDSIPIIDLTSLSSANPASRRALATEIRTACLKQGFFYIKNHPVPASTIADVFETSKEFYAQPDSVKNTVDISKSGGNFRGWMAMYTENNDPNNKGDRHEAFNLGLEPGLLPDEPVPDNVEGELQHGENLWPTKDAWEKSVEFRERTLAYYKAVLEMGQKLFPLFALALDLPEDFFDDKTRHPAAIMRLLYYPGLGEERADELKLGCGAHTDYECFTILCQDEVEGALQVRNRSGEWINAPPIPGTFVINVGDQFARWTNDIFISTPHRVLPPSRDRYSIPFFFGCDHQVPLIPPSTCVTADRPNRYPVVETAGGYVARRLRETYTVGPPKA